MSRYRDSKPPPQSTVQRSVIRYEKSRYRSTGDSLSVEEPLEIRVVAEIDGRRVAKSVAVTMRTPGEDHDLVTGFLVSEGVVRGSEDIWKIEHCRQGEDPVEDNVVDVHLAPSVEFDLERLSRLVMTSSACGICGRASIESVEQICSARPSGEFRLNAEEIHRLGEELKRAQGVFAHTGGTHAAALFSVSGEILALREDVGRHNALDKLVGWLLWEDRLPAAHTLVVVSGRASFELVQKSILAGIPMLAAVGAPSSLAVDLAMRYGTTLIGFLRDGRFNVYCGGGRVSTG